MYERWSGFLIRNGIIGAEDAEVQEYGLFCLLSTVGFQAVQLILALWFHVLAETIFFDALFFPLRSYAGGYHAKTPMRCFWMSNAVWALAMIGGRILPVRLCAAAGVLAAAAVWRMAPLPHENNPLSEKRFAQVKRTARGIVTAETGIMLALTAAGWAVFGRLAAIVLLCTAVSMAAVKGERKTGEKMQ